MNIAFDTETYPFYQNGKATKDIVPRLVCMSYCIDGGTPVLVERERAIPLFKEWLEIEGACFIGLNLAFDMAVMARAMEEAYPEEAQALFNKIYAAKKWDVGIETKLYDISLGGMFLRGRYSLAALTERWLGEKLDGKVREGLGPDVWRNRYNELEGKRAEDYPAAAYAYALRDADVTWRIFHKLRTVKSVNSGGVPVRSQYAFDLHLMSAWGLMVDGQWTRALRTHYEAEAAKYRGILEQEHITMPDGKDRTLIEGGTKKRPVIQEVIRRAWAEIGENPILTDKGAIKADAKTMKYLEGKGVTEPIFQWYSRMNRSEKFLSTYLDPLTDAGDGPLCPRYNETVDSGRTSASGPNVQNFPSRVNAQDSASLKAWEELTEGEGEDDDESEPIDRLLAGMAIGPDIRGCFIPRPGYVFVAADYTAIEMAGLAQICRNITGQLGTLALAINNGMDLHLYVTAKLLNMSYEDAVARYKDGDPVVVEMRQISKIANYGFAGGASPRTFVEYADGFGVKITQYDAEKMRAAWGKAWTEVDPYFRHINSLQSVRGSFHVEQHGPGRRTSGWRTRVTNRFPAAANTGFQGIVADGALYSVHLVQKACYTELESPLYGSHGLLFVHDEILIETPVEKAEVAAPELSRLMVMGMKVFLPDLLVEAKPKILRERWAK